MIRLQIDLDGESDRILLGTRPGLITATWVKPWLTFYKPTKASKPSWNSVRKLTGLVARQKGMRRAGFPRGALHNLERGQAAQRSVIVLFAEGVPELFALISGRFLFY